MAHRPHPPYVRDRLIARVAAGELIQDVCAEPGQPSTAAVAFWARRDSVFAAALAAAKESGRYIRGLRFDEAKAQRLLDRLAAGETITAILRDPATPSQRAYAHWRATQAAFAAEVFRLNQVKREAKIARNRRRFRAFDPALAERIVARVLCGARLCDVSEAPARHVLTRWRRQRPDFDAELKAAIALRRAWRGGLGTVRPDLLHAIWARILHGETLATIGLAPGMPCRTTLYAWMRRDPAFRDTVAQALHFRRDWLGDLAADLVADRIAGVPGAKRAWENLLGKANRIEARLERWGYYTD